MKIVKVTAENYHLFDDMVYFRMNHEERKSEKESYHIDEAIKNELLNENLFLYAAEIDQKMVGWISLIYLPKVGRLKGQGYIYVDELWTMPSLRGKGVGQMLMKEADALRIEKNAVGIRLFVNQDNESAKKLYEKSGYKYVEETYFMEKYPE